MVSSVNASATPKVVKDRSSAFNLWILINGILLAVAVVAAALIPEIPGWLPQGPKQPPIVVPVGWLVLARVAAAVFGIGAVVLTFAKNSNDAKFKAQEAAQRGSLEEQKKALADEKVELMEELEAERVRIVSVVNGALQTTARELGKFLTIGVMERRRQLSGLQATIVNKAEQLVRNPAPRAAYYRIEGEMGSRVMTPLHPVSHDRVDEFGTIFDEADGNDTNVWSLVDRPEAMAVLVDNLDRNVPPGFTRTTAQKYKSYISAPVRAGDHAFGMLTVNTLESYGLDERDRSSMQLLARLLAIAEASAMTSAEWNKLT
jgi:hypothetical protein